MSGIEPEAVPAPSHGIAISTDPGDVDIDVVFRFLDQQSSWSRGVPRPVVVRAIENSLCFSARLDGEFIGFARVVTDRATFAYLGDVFVLPPSRGLGVSKALMAAIDAHPDLQGLRRFVLATSDAHGLYAQFGFTALAQPARYMERYRPEVYSRPTDDTSV